MRIDNKFDIEQEVYLRTDIDQSVRIVTSIQIRANNLLMYEISCGVQTTWHYEFELSEEKNILL
jgi:hypothetical protein